jgi:hypothetical protein
VSDDSHKSETVTSAAAHVTGEGEPALVVGEGEAAAAASPFSLTRALVAAGLARLLTFAAAGLAVTIFGVNPASWAVRYPRKAEVFHGLLGNFLNPWAHWDGVWFIKIAFNGYASNDGSVAFFPLFPLVLRWVGVAFANNLVVAGIVFSLACYLGAMALLYRLVRAEFDAKTAYRTVFYLSLFPTAFFFQAVYSESLFLLLALACFTWSRSSHWKLAGLAGLLATLTRSTGIMLLLPMAYYYYRERGFSLRRTDAKAASLLMIPEGLMVWMAYLSLGFHSPLLFAQAQDQWRRFIAPPNYTLWQGVVATFGGLLRVVWSGAPVLWPAPTQGSEAGLAIVNTVALAALAFAIQMLWKGAARLPVPYTAFAVAMIGFPLLFPAHYQPLMSMPRFVLAAFPLFMTLALLTRDRPRTHVWVTVVFVVISILLVAKFAIFSWVA